MKSSMIKIMEKVLIFFTVRLVVILFGCLESVGKLRILFPFFFSSGSDTIFVSPIFFLFIKKHKIVFGNLIMICGERLCFSAWLKNCGFRVCEI